MLFSIRTKLFFLVLIGFSALILVTSWQIRVKANDVSSKSLERSLQQSSTVLTTKLVSRFLSIKETAKGIAKDGRVLPLVFDSESLTLQELSVDFRKAIDFDILFFTDDSGNILARSDRPEAIGRNVSGSALFNDALNGNEAQGIFQSKGKLLQMVVLPIFDNVASDIVRGTVAIAYEISKETVEEIHALTDSAVSVMVFSRNRNREIEGVKSTYTTDSQLGARLEGFYSNQTERWKSIGNASVDYQKVTYTIDSEDFYGIVHRLKSAGDQPLGFILVLKSRTELLRPFIEIQHSVLVIGLICLLLASALSGLLSIRMSRPIIEVAGIARLIQDGKYAKKDKKAQVNDEIGDLYNAVIGMGNALQEKADLENYLAQMSNELDISESANIDTDSFGLVNQNQDIEDDDATIINDETGDNTVPRKNSSALEGKGGSLFQKDNVIDKRYKIIRPIGSGAMGHVYLVLDLDLDEQVAIKIMEKDLFSRQQSISFKEEIRLARRITHRNIVRTFDFGSWNEYYYITMEYLSGYDLDLLLKTKGAFDSNIGVIMARQICSAMIAAHEQGIIHRDLKPSNMIINRQGILKIMDFGLAMNIQEKNVDKENSKFIEVAGTPRYMAPEQFFGEALDERTDIYAIGIILYSIFSGVPPFDETDFELLAKMHSGVMPPPITTSNGDLSRELEKVIFKALKKKPELRYQSVRDLLSDLNNLSDK